MSVARTTLAVLFTLLLLAPAGSVGPPPGPWPGEIARWIEDLGDDSFRVRRTAAARLRAAGEKAEPALEKAALSSDAEVAATARAILDEFRWGIYPGTPAKIVELVKTYRGSTDQFNLKRREVIKDLLLHGPAGARVVWKFTRAEGPGVLRTVLFADIASTLTHGMPLLVEHDRLDLAEQLLEPGAREGNRLCMAHFAAVAAMRGTLSARIAALEAEAKKGPADRHRSAWLVFLLRANNDRARAAKVADDAGLTDLEEAMLYEAGDWKALHARPERVNSSLHTRQKGYQAAYARLAGDRKAADKLLDGLLHVYSNNLDPMPYAKVLFCNGRARDGLDLLGKNHQGRKVAFEVLAAQGQYSLAFDTIEQARRAGVDVALLEVLEARELYALGERQRADELRKKYADQLDRGTVGVWAEELLQADVQNGRRAEALSVAANILKHSRDSTWPGRIFDKLFPGRTEEAHALWDALGFVYDKDTAARNMTRLDTFLENKATAKDLGALLEAGKARARDIKELDRLWWGLGEAAAALGKRPDAEACLRKSKLPYALVRHGDLAASGKQWAEAARRYWAAFQQAARTTVPPTRAGEDAKDFVCALALYLHGHALRQDGKSVEGKKRIEQAHGLLLADGPQNWALAKALAARDHKEAATRQYLQMSRLCEPVLHERGSFYSGEGHRGIALAAVAKKDYLLAADGWERCFLRLMVPTTNFTRGHFYATSMAFVHQTRARGLVLAGKIDEAKAEIALVRTFLPISTDLATHLVPELEQRGKKKEADELYRAIQAELEKVLKDYPKAAGLLNRSAWLSATCRRELDKAEKRAREAVKLAPESASHHNALAEVLFQREKKADALAAVRKAIALAPRNTFYQRQLKRIEAGDAKVKVAVEE